MLGDDSVENLGEWDELAHWTLKPYICSVKATLDYPEPPPKKKCEIPGII